jgi:DNA mismatch repair protein MutS2
MHPSVFRALEFDRIREALARAARTSLGRARAEALTPASGASDVWRLLSLTTEGVRFLNDGGTLSVSAPPDLPSILAAIEIEGQPLEPLQLLGLARLLDSVDDVVNGLGRGAHRSTRQARGAAALPETPFPLLSALVATAASFAPEVARVQRAIEPSGDVSDTASPALSELRDALRRQRAKLRNTL